MSETNHKPEKPEAVDSKEIYGSVDTIQTQLESIEKFVARRFDEISMEINATSQQVEMTEEGIGARFAEILEILKAVSFSGDGKTPANAGVELDAVVEMTEMAATRILDAADRIGSRVHKELQSDDDRKAAVDDIDKDIEEIFLACSFQDITGQRIRKTLENLKTIEERLGTALDKIGIKVDDIPAAAATEAPVNLSEGASQADIDALFDDD